MERKSIASDLLRAANELASAANDAACKSRELASIGTCAQARVYLDLSNDASDVAHKLVSRAFKIRLMMIILPSTREEK